ncbi:MAG: PAS domain S-box protein [Desulfobacteraceae bacterium]|jgi:PAS domain S-box-containing protein|nr:PAS domain S-box protein [Desulfobacteraceae bacterium]
MLNELLKSNIAMVGGGNFCRQLLQLLFSEQFKDQHPSILGVADKNDQAEGLLYAQKLGILTTADYRDLYQLENLQILMELTGNVKLGVTIKMTKPLAVKFFDHVDCRTIWTSLQVEAEKRKALKLLHEKKDSTADIDAFFEQFAERLGNVIIQRSNRYVEIERESIESEIALSQIIEGSTIPTFVINKDHVVTHWNRAMENLTGAKAETMVGTTRQSTPFWGEERPTMADVILDQIGKDEIKKLYGEKWRESVLIEEAYEAEVFFPRLGENGKWCWFTAAPIKDNDGTIVGAIETLWDKTEDKKAEEEREYHTRELSTLNSIYSALNAPSDLESRINQAVRELLNFLSADGICIYMLDKNGQYSLRHSQGLSDDACKKVNILGEKSIIHRVAQNNEFTIYENLPEGCLDEICLLEEEKIASLAYVPISSKEKKTLGVIRICSKTPTFFSHEQKNVLELIGHRIGLAIENAMLQEQYIKSEEKYRTLFNSDPHPIFILDSKTFKILDMNKRAQDDYGYSRKELRQLTFLQLGDESDEELTAGLQNLTEDQSPLFTKKRHHRKGGKPFFVNVNVSLAKYGVGHVIIATTTDITEVVEKETQLIQAGKMTTLGVMAAGMAHEINQPLNVIQVCADFFLKMLKRGAKIEDDDLRSMANDIVANVERATGVIKHVRDFARQSEPVRSKVNINDPIEDVFKVLGHQLKVHEIDITLDLDPDLPEIIAEHNRLEQVFINLVSNAIDAMDEKSNQPDNPDDSKKLTIKSIFEDERVTVYVTDTGTGMSEEVQAKLFEPFFTTKKVGKGTGLGVSISYGIVKDYDGSIEIESAIGKGTTFKLTFPAATA